MNLASILDEHLIPDLANIVVEYHFGFVITRMTNTCDTDHILVFHGYFFHNPKEECEISFEIEGTQQCCEVLSIFVDDENCQDVNCDALFIDRVITDVKLEPELEKKWTHDKYFEGGAFGVRLYFDDDTTSTVTLVNQHNGYYSHGFQFYCWKYDVSDSI
jgi:hypothetical protein